MDEALREEHYTYDGLQLAHSGFNLNWMKEYIGEPKTIIEFGSFDGGDGLRYKLTYPNCDIYSIEADPELYIKIKKFEKYGLKVFNYAVYDKNGEVEFNRCRFKEPYYCYNKGDVGGSGSIMQPSQYNKDVILHQYYEDKPIIVPAITLEQFCNEQKIKNIDLIHIDVEGSILPVLRGFGLIRPKVIFIEIDGAQLFYKDVASFEIIDKILKSWIYELKYRSSVDSLYVRK